METRRAARVFISSTFQDMERERDMLTRGVFPRLRARFARHGVALFDVDLRWGITPELARTRGILQLCLEQVETCRPLFFCMLGQRYGWRPPHEGSGSDPRWSVTELEIRRALAAAVRPLFFLRADALSQGDRPDDTAAMAALKQWIRGDPRAVIHEYSDFEEFEVRAEQALAMAIEAWVAAGEGSDPHLWRGVLRPEVSRMIERACNARRPAILTGPSGCGSSWLGAHWARGREKSQSIGLVIDGRQVNGQRGLAAAIRAAREQHGLNRVSLTAGLASLEDELAALALAAQRSKVEVRVFIDHLDDIYAAHAQIDLANFPRRLPPLCKVLVATRLPRCIASAGELEFNVVEVDVLKQSLSQSFACRYLEQFGKSLTDQQAVTLSSSRFSGNVGSLVLCLEDLRRVPRMETLEARVQHLAKLPDEESVIATLLDALRSSVPEEFRHALDYVLLSLSLSVRGLEEAELCAALSGCFRRDLPTYVWITIRSGLGQLLAMRGERIDLVDGAIRRAACALRARHPGVTRRIAMAVLEALKQSSIDRWNEEAPHIAWLIEGEPGLREHLQMAARFIDLQHRFPNYAEGMFDLLGDSRAAVLAEWQRQVPVCGASTEQLWQLGLLAVRAAELDVARAFWAMARAAGDWSEAHTLSEALVLRDTKAAEGLAHYLPPTKSGRSTVSRSEADQRWMRAATFLALVGERLMERDAERDSKWIAETQYCMEQLADDETFAHGWTLIGQLHCDDYRRKDAVRAFERAIKSARRCGHARRLCVALGSCSRAYIELHRFRKARSLAVEALELSRECHLFEQECEAIECLIQVERLRANWEAAFQLCERYIQRTQAAGRNLDRAKERLRELEP